MKHEHEVGVAEAKREFSHLLGRVAYGKERITILRRGRAVARLVPIGDDPARPGLADAKGWLEADDPFFGELERVVAARRRHRPRVREEK
jgi:prevent-host-death family protein